VNKALDRAIDILTARRDDLDKAAAVSLAKETLTQEDLMDHTRTDNPRQGAAPAA